MNMKNKTKKLFQLKKLRGEIDTQIKELTTDIINSIDNPHDKKIICDGAVYHCIKKEAAKNYYGIKEVLKKAGLDEKDYFTTYISETIKEQKTK